MNSTMTAEKASSSRAWKKRDNHVLRCAIIVEVLGSLNAKLHIKNKITPLVRQKSVFRRHYLRFGRDENGDRQNQRRFRLVRERNEEK